jgi:hypothetical protein
MFDWHLALGIASGLLAFVAIAPYIKDILYGTTRPNIVSWALWVLLLLIALWAQVSAGASWSLILLIGDLIGTTTISILCLVGYGYGKYNWLDGVCFALAIVAILLWQVTHQPVLAIVFAAIADLLASVPTLVKAYKDPLSEDPTQFLMIAGAALLGVSSTVILSPANLIFPIYLFCINGSIGMVALSRKRLLRE